MKRICLIPVLLVGCASSRPPPVAYVNPTPPVVQLVLESKVQQMGRQEVINATQDCETNGMRAVPIMSKRMVSGMMSDIIIDVHCMPRPKFPYQEKEMINFIVGVLLGFFVATFGITGVASALDKGVEALKHVKISTEK